MSETERDYHAISKVYFDAFLETKVPGMVCQLCRLETLATLVRSDEVTTAEVRMLSGQKLLQVQCNNCGYVHLFAHEIVLDWVDSEREHGQT